MLRIDLLPGHFAAARAAKTMLVAMVVAILVTVLGCFGMLTMKKAELARVTKDYDEWKVKADEVRGIETKAGEKEALAAPIDAKVTFIEDADGCGEQWWDAYEKVNRYVYAQARVTTIRIQAPSTVHFEVDLPDTTSVGRFVLNLIRCPDITGIRIGGAPPPGPGIGANARPSSGGGGGMGGMGPGMGGGMPGGMPGMGGPEMGMMGGGMPGPGGGGAPAAASSAGGPIHLTVDAALTTPLATPAPGGGAAAAAAGGGMAMGGMPGGGMPGGGMPGGGMPGMAGPPGGGGAGAAPGPSAAGGSKGGGGDEGGGGGGLGKGGGGDMDVD